MALKHSHNYVYCKRFINFQMYFIKICVRGSCIASSTDLTPVDGQWGAFGPPSSCTRSCGIGVRYRERQCDNPE